MSENTLEKTNQNILAPDKSIEYFYEKLSYLYSRCEVSFKMSLSAHKEIGKLKNRQKSLEDRNAIASISTTFSDKKTDDELETGMTIDYIVEYGISQRMIEVLSEMEGVLGDPTSFESVLSTFLNLLEDLYQRESQREVYFSDLLSMLRMAFSSIECDQLTKEGISTIREAVSYLCHEVTASQLQGLRQKFRENAVDILQPFRCNVDIKSVLGEMYPDEVST